MSFHFSDRTAEKSGWQCSSRVILLVQRASNILPSRLSSALYAERITLRL
jgi:hypothetical protein